MEPLASHFEGVSPRHDRQIVLDLRTPQRFVDVRVQEVRIAEAKCDRIAHARVGRNIGLDRVAGPQFPRVGHVELVELAGGKRREEIQVEDVDLRRTLDAIGGVSVRGHIEGLVVVLGVVEVVGRAQRVGRIDDGIHFAENGGVVDRVIDRVAFLLTPRGPEEVEERQALTLGAADDQRFMRRIGNDGHRNRARAERLTQVGPLEVLVDVLERAEEKHAIALDRAADHPAGLLAVEVGRRSAIRGVRRQSLQALEVKETAVQIIGARLGNDVDHAASGAAELRVGPARHDLEFLDRLQRDVDRRTLAAKLLAEEPVVVVTAVEADVVVHASLAAEGDLVAIRALDDAHSRSEGEKILELPAQDGRRADGGLIERITDFRAGDVDVRRAGDGDGLRCS